MSAASRRRRYGAEALGTFCLVFFGTGAMVVNQLNGGALGVVGIGLVFGLTVLTMVYTVGPISGAHLNPAVTLGFYFAGRHARRDLLPYIVSQLAGAVVASFLLKELFGNTPAMLGITLPAGSYFQSLVIETILTFILMWVILSVARDDRAEGILAGVAIGATIALEAIMAGPVSGASMNPARSLGPAIAVGMFKAQWIYIVGPLTGSLLGTAAYKTLNGS
jgi:MIP family channel proteins